MTPTRAERLLAAGWTRIRRACEWPPQAYECGCKGPTTRHCRQPGSWVRPGYDKPRCATHAIAVTEEYRW